MNDDTAPPLSPLPPRLPPPTILRRIILFPPARLALAALLYLAFLRAFGIIDGRLAPLSLGVPERIGEFVSALGTLLLLGKAVERRSLAEVGLGSRHALRDTAAGLALGWAMMSAIIATMALAGWYTIDSVDTGAAAWTELLRLSMVLCLAAAVEEILFRGITFRIVEEALGTWLALLVSAAFFGYAHLDNPNTTWVGIVGVMLGGVLLGSAFVLTRNLWFVTSLHWAWNFFQGPVYGAPVSGFRPHALIHARIEGPEAWTGGAFGPEAGLVTLMIDVAATAALLAVAWRHKKIVTPAWMRRRLGNTQARSAPPPQRTTGHEAKPGLPR